MSAVPELAEAAAGATTPSDDAALWYKDAVIYQLNVKAFFDSNNDGIGDFRGVTAQARLREETSASTRSG